jgi:Ca2+-binding EF-hand superfamily protein
MQRRKAAAAFRLKLESIAPTFREVWNNLLASFTSWDANGDGFLDIDEFHYGCGIHNIPMTKSEAGDIFSAFDDDGNGMLDLEEFESIVLKEGKKAAVAHFKQCFSGMGRSELSRLEDTFQRFDTNKNGTVDRLEFRLGTEQVFAATLSEEDVSLIWEKFDMKPADELELQEFLDLMKVAFEADVVDKFRGKKGFGGAALDTAEAAIEGGVRLERSDSVDGDEDLRMQGDIETVSTVNIQRRASQMDKGRLQELLNILCRSIGKTREGAKRFEMELAADTLGWSRYASRKLHALYLRLGKPLREYAKQHKQSPVATMGFKLAQLGGHIDKDPDRFRLTTSLVLGEQPGGEDPTYTIYVPQRDLNALLEDAEIRIDPLDMSELYDFFGSSGGGRLSSQALYDLFEEIYESDGQRLLAETRVTERLYLDVMLEIYAQINGINETPIDWDTWTDEARKLVATDWEETRRKLKQQRKAKELELTNCTNSREVLKDLLSGFKQELQQLTEDEMGMDASVRGSRSLAKKGRVNRTKASTFAAEDKPIESVEYMSLERFKAAIFGVIDMWTETMQVDNAQTQHQPSFSQFILYLSCRSGNTQPCCVIFSLGLMSRPQDATALRTTSRYALCTFDWLL